MRNNINGLLDSKYFETLMEKTESPDVIIVTLSHWFIVLSFTALKYVNRPCNLKSFGRKWH